MDGSSSSPLSLADSYEPYDGTDSSEYQSEAGVVSEEARAGGPSSEPGAYYYVDSKPYKWLPWIWNSPHEDDVKLQMAQELAAAQEHLSSAELLRRLQVGRLEAAARERRFTNMLSGLVDWVMGSQPVYDNNAPQQQEGYEYYDGSSDAATVDSNNNYFDEGVEYDGEDDEQEEEYEDDAEWEAAFRAAGLRSHEGEEAAAPQVEANRLMGMQDDLDNDDNANTITLFSSEPDASVTSTITTTTTTGGDSTSSNEVFVYGSSGSGSSSHLGSALVDPVAVLQQMVDAVLGQGMDPLMALRQANLHAQLAHSHDAMYELEEQEQRAAENAALLQWVDAAAVATTTGSLGSEGAQEPLLDEAQFDWWWTAQKPLSSGTEAATTETATAAADQPSFFSNVASVFSLFEEDGSLNWDAAFLALLVAGCISVLAGVISSYRSLRRTVRSHHRCLRQPLLVSEGGHDDDANNNSGDLVLPVVLQHEDGLQQPGYVLLDHNMAPVACWPSKAVMQAGGAGAKQQQQQEAHFKGGMKGDSKQGQVQQQQSNELAPHQIVGAQPEAAHVLEEEEQQQQQEEGVVYAADHIAPSSKQ